MYECLINCNINSNKLYGFYIRLPRHYLIKLWVYAISYEYCCGKLNMKDNKFEKNISRIIKENFDHFDEPTAESCWKINYQNFNLVCYDIRKDDVFQTLPWGNLDVGRFYPKLFFMYKILTGPNL